MRDKHFLNLLAFASILGIVLAVNDIELQDGLPEKKLISTFQIVRFPNDACMGTNNRNGTCYTSAECSDKDGTSSGSCADGFGVCCTFVIQECGKTSSENITYWDAPSSTSYISNTAPTVCGLKVCPINNNICQFRIDFTTFVITGPSSSTFSEMHSQSGNILGAGATAPIGNANQVASWKTNCLADTFSISGVSTSNSPNVMCGTVATGTHIYVDANTDACNDMNFNFSPNVGPAPAASGASGSRGVSNPANRDWDITIHQYECGHINQAPPGCTQYLYGPVTGVVTSFNYAVTNVHLANQNQKICIRRERGRCWACFANAGATSFDISSAGGTNSVRSYPTQACGYGCEADNGIGAADDHCSSYDCVIIPGAFVMADASIGTRIAGVADMNTNAQATYRVPVAPQIGGFTNFGLGNAIAPSLINTGLGADNTVCTQHVPFQLTFKSDGFEGTGPAGEHRTDPGAAGAAGGNMGFNLNYALIAC